MISFNALLSLAFLVTFIYLANLAKKALYIYEHKNYSDYKSYQNTVRKTGSKVFRPARPRDEEGIHRIKGDRQKMTVKSSNGIAHTEDTAIPIFDANPEDVMDSIDENGNIKG